MSTSLNDLVVRLYTEVTKRPDLAEMSEGHLKNAILKAHTKDYWVRDIFETNFQFGSAATIYSLEPKSIIPRYRKHKYLNIVDPTSFDTTYELKYLTAPTWLDGYGYLQDNVYYEAGDTLKIRVSSQAKVFGIGCYIYPDTTLANYPSWIVDEFPLAILYEAARTMFRIIGKPDEAAKMELLVAEAMALVTETGLGIVGE